MVRNEFVKNVEFDLFIRNRPQERLNVSGAVVGGRGDFVQRWCDGSMPSQECSELLQLLYIHRSCVQRKKKIARLQVHIYRRTHRGVKTDAQPAGKLRTVLPPV